MFRLTLPNIPRPRGALRLPVVADGGGGLLLREGESPEEDAVEAGEELCPSCQGAMKAGTCTGCGLVQQSTVAAGVFDESKHPRVKSGQHGGGQFTVKANDQGRFDVINQDNGKKVAETTDAADAQVVADEKNSLADAVTGLTDEQLQQNLATWTSAPESASRDEALAQINAEVARRGAPPFESVSHGPGDYSVTNRDTGEELARVRTPQEAVAMEDAANEDYFTRQRASVPLVESGYHAGTPIDELPAIRQRLHDELVQRGDQMRDTEFSVKRAMLSQAGGWWPNGLEDWSTPEGRALREEIATKRPLLSSAGPGVHLDSFTADIGGGLTLAEPPVEDVVLEDCDECMEFAEAVTAAIPVAPPDEWFQDPQFDGPTPITITSDGRVMGHAGVWGVCHIGWPRGAGRCVPMPHSRTGYSKFHLGGVITASGTELAIGNITLDTGHAPMRVNGQPVGAMAAAAHYDDTGTVVADVRAGEDKHGVWFSGALRPDVTASVVRKLLGAKISGDWRGGELVGMLGVNVPGFPVPRTDAVIRAAGGEEFIDALVAAGIVPDPPAPAVDVHLRAAVLEARAGGLEALERLAVYGS